jgi:hypothetical protein
MESQALTVRLACQFSLGFFEVVMSNPNRAGYGIIFVECRGVGCKGGYVVIQDSSAPNGFREERCEICKDSPQPGQIAEAWQRTRSK